MHPLLARQLRKAAIDTTTITAFVEAIDAAYVAADEERRQLERSLALASDELYDQNRRLEHELEQRKRLEVELQHAEKLRAVGQLAAGVAHEINTPVQYIGDSVSFLSDAFSELAPLLAASDNEDIGYLREEMPRALERCRDGASRVAAIVRALKTLAHPDATDQQPADIAAAVQNTLLVCANELKYIANVELDLASTRRVCCHIGEVQQVLLNLIVNAAHAIADRVGDSGTKGTITISTRDDGDDVVIEIGDDGPGIPAALRPRIFEPFFTTKPLGKGSGQGLSLAHTMVVDHHGGTLTFDSSVGIGTTFKVRLPVGGRQARKKEAA